MKKTILFSVLSILVFVLIFGLYNAMQLRQINIQKSVVIDAGMEKIFTNIVMLEKFPAWSPFYEADPSQTIELKGVDGKVGAQYHWGGSNGDDLGYQEITKIKPLSYIKMECTITKPFEANPIFEYSFSKLNANQTKVVQNFELNSGIVDAFFMWLFGAKG